LKETAIPVNEPRTAAHDACMNGLLTEQYSVSYELMMSRIYTCIYLIFRNVNDVA